MNNLMPDANAFIQVLVGKTLLYGLKSPDTDLYDFGFGDADSNQCLSAEPQVNCTHALHVICRFKVINKSCGNTIRKYHENSSAKQFHSAFKDLLGLKVLRVALSEKNDLWLDLGMYWIAFSTFENDIESWRFFSTDFTSPHMVVSNSGIIFVK